MPHLCELYTHIGLTYTIFAGFLVIDVDYYKLIIDHKFSQICIALAMCSITDRSSLAESITWDNDHQRPGYYDAEQDRRFKIYIIPLAT
jgi:hypothetical protein